jgi:hypothetical protein
LPDVTENKKADFSSAFLFSVTLIFYPIPIEEM